MPITNSKLQKSNLTKVLEKAVKIMMVERIQLILNIKDKL